MFQVTLALSFLMGYLRNAILKFKPTINYLHHSAGQPNFFTDGSMSWMAAQKLPRGTTPTINTIDVISSHDPRLTPKLQPST